MVEPTFRLTAEQALAHPFFLQYQKEEVRLFSPRKTFRVSFSFTNSWNAELVLGVNTTSQESFTFSGLDRDCFGLYTNAVPLQSSQTANKGASGKRPIFPAWCAEAHRWLCFPHIWTLGEERRATEPSRSVPEHS